MSDQPEWNALTEATFDELFCEFSKRFDSVAIIACGDRDDQHTGFTSRYKGNMFAVLGMVNYLSDRVRSELQPIGSDYEHEEDDDDDEAV